MSDAHGRELERRYRETGDPQVGAAWLMHRVRIGELDQGRVYQAAIVGHPAAVNALPFAPKLFVFIPQPVADTDAIRTLVMDRVEDDSRQLAVRIGLAALDEVQQQLMLMTARIEPCLESFELWQAQWPGSARDPLGQLGSAVNNLRHYVSGRLVGTIPLWESSRTIRDVRNVMLHIDLARGQRGDPRLIPCVTLSHVFFAAHAVLVTALPIEADGLDERDRFQSNLRGSLDGLLFFVNETNLAADVPGAVAREVGEWLIRET